MIDTIEKPAVSTSPQKDKPKCSLRHPRTGKSCGSFADFVAKDPCGDGIVYICQWHHYTLEEIHCTITGEIHSVYPDYDWKKL